MSQALLAALQQQRNAALDSCAMLAADLDAARKRIIELEAQLEKPDNPAA